MQSVKDLVANEKDLNSYYYRVCSRTQTTLHYIAITDNSDNLDTVRRIIDMVSEARPDLHHKDTRVYLVHGITQVATIIFESEKIEQLQLPI